MAAEAVEADITGEDARRALMARITAAAPLGCVVNNASAFEPDTGLDFEPDAALRQLGVNLIAPISLARLLATQPSHDAGNDAAPSTS